MLNILEIETLIQTLKGKKSLKKKNVAVNIALAKHRFFKNVFIEV